MHAVLKLSFADNFIPGYAVFDLYKKIVDGVQLISAVA